MRNSKLELKWAGRTARALMMGLCTFALIPYGMTQNPAATGNQQPAANPPATSTPPPGNQPASAGKPAGAEQAVKIPADQLDALVAPIALYPDPLLAQTLAACTYPLEIVQLKQWLDKNPNLKDEKAKADAVSKQDWDPSVQSMAAFPDVVKRLADDIQWTTDLGNAFLAQQSEVMDAVQRMRKKAQDNGKLTSNEQQKVETKTVESQSVIVIEQANPQVVYVPSYNPAVVYGAPVYPYPPIYYPPYVPGQMFVSFSFGVAMGAMFSGGWGYGCGWGHTSNVQINNYNNFNRNANIRAGNTNVGRNGNWNHNPQHRGGAPYADRATADRFGGSARGDSLANRQAGARQQIGQQGGNVGSNRGGGDGIGNSGGAGARGGADPGGARGGGNSAAGSRGGGTGAGAGGGSDRIGGQDLSRSGGGSRDAFGGGSRGYNGSSTRASSSRGASSMGSRGGGARGGGRGGGRR
jgi:hypothetical protein